MNIRLSYDFNLHEFKTLLPEIQLYDENDKEDIDLLIFPGGEDVSLSYYLDEDNQKRFQNLCGTNEERDGIEKNILYEALSGNKTVNKILGVCRGVQFLNVMFGGTLFPHLDYFGIQHPGYHTITHHNKNNLDFFLTVNSLHHQGIRNTGGNYGKLGIRTYPVQIAMDNNGDVTEIISWMNDKILGIQFHPEYYASHNKDKNKFREFLYSWMAGNTTILK